MWELDHKESWASKNWCFWTVVLEKTLKSPLDCREIKPVNPKGNQSWIFIGRTDAEAETPVLWPANMKSQLIGRDPDAGKAGREGANKGWDGWTASSTQLDISLSKLRRWWRTEKPRMLHSTGSQRVGHDWDWTTTAVLGVS